MSLNEIPPDLKETNALCPTDSRLRPDIRKLEAGDIDGAAAEKTRLEEKQRDAKKTKKSKKSDDWQPRLVLWAMQVLCGGICNGITWLKCYTKNIFKEVNIIYA